MVAARPLKTQKGPGQTVAVAGSGHAPLQPTQGWQSEEERVAVGKQVGVAVAGAVAAAAAMAAKRKSVAKAAERESMEMAAEMAVGVGWMMVAACCVTMTAVVLCRELLRAAGG